MLQAFSGVTTLIQSTRRSSETFVFFLHYRVTFLILIFCCILISTHQFIDEKISCDSKQSSQISTKFLNVYCWSTSTYSVASGYLKEAGVDVPHPGVVGSENESEYEYRNFYQYIHIVLFLQAVLFYMPHLIWKICNPEFMSTIPAALNEIVQSTDDKTNETTLNAVAIFIENRWNSHKLLPLKYLMCEILAIVNLLVQSFLLDVFLHGKFLKLGLLLESYYNSKILSDPIKMFPIVTICNFRRYGASGYIEEINSLCILPINAINGKIFLCLWIWFAFLLILSFCNLVYLSATMVIPYCRLLPEKVNSLIFKEDDKDSYLKLINMAGVGDWFVLSSLRRNIDEVTFDSLTENILSRIDKLEIEA